MKLMAKSLVTSGYRMGMGKDMDAGKDAILWQITQRAEPDIQRVQAPADISRSALRCHSNETHAPTENPPNSTQLEGATYHSPKVTSGSVQ